MLYQLENRVPQLADTAWVADNAAVIGTGIGAALLLGILASLWPAWQAMTQPIVKNLRS